MTEFDGSPMGDTATEELQKMLRQSADRVLLYVVAVACFAALLAAPGYFLIQGANP